MPLPMARVSLLLIATLYLRVWIVLAQQDGTPTDFSPSLITESAIPDSDPSEASNDVSTELNTYIDDNASTPTDLADVPASTTEAISDELDSEPSLYPFAADPTYRGFHGSLIYGVDVDVLNTNKLRIESVVRSSRRCTNKLGFYRLVDLTFLDKNDNLYDYKSAVAFTFLNTTLYEGPVRGLLSKNNSEKNMLMVSYDECKKACGNQVDYYDWDEIQYTMSSWLLPIFGVIVSLPYESNKLWATIMMAIRWIGNPIICFAVVLWNIRVTAKCGKLVDLAEDFWEDSLETRRRPGKYEREMDEMWSPLTAIDRPYESGQFLASERDPSTTSLAQRHSTFEDMDSSLATVPLKYQNAGFAEDAPTYPVFAHRLPKTTATSTTYIGTDSPMPSGFDTAFTPSRSKSSQQTSYGSFWNWALGFSEDWMRRISAVEAEAIYGPVDPSKMRNSRPTLKRQYPPLISEIRDSLYILSIINQFETDRDIQHILWYALFTRFQVVAPTRTNLSSPPIQSAREPLDYVQRRSEIADYCRKDRKRGIVILMATQLWFLASFFMNIASSFTDTGSNHKAHSLGLGIFLCWLPMLSVATLVDRNSVHTEDIRKMITDFLLDVARDREIVISEGSPLVTFFAGQGRRKFHYGKADQMLEVLECRLNHLQNGGRDHEPLERGWSKFYDNNILVELSFSEVQHGMNQLSGKRKDESETLSKDQLSEHAAFDTEEVWQVISSFVLVLLPLSGAFTISYHTPTIGLSCRSGGYMVFGILVSAVFAIEMLGWHPYFRHQRARDPRPRLALKFFITIFESANVLYLIYFLTSLTVGAFNNCFCRASMWGGGRGAGYVTFNDERVSWLFRQNFDLSKWWKVATGLGSVPLLFGIGYAVLEWCLQSHLWSDQPEKARHGLMMVRRWRNWTYIFYRPILAFSRVPHYLAMGRGVRYPLVWIRWKASR